MAGKSYAVLGLGRFGFSVAASLAAQGGEVLAIDKNKEHVAEIADKVTVAASGDVTDPQLYKRLGIGNMDAVVIGIAQDFEACVMAVILAKEAGVPYVLAKAQSDIHANVLRKIGADEVILPERAMGARIAKNMVLGKFVDAFELSETYSMVEMSVPDTWVGKTLRELELRRRYGVNIIGIRSGNDIRLAVQADEPFEEGQVVLLAGNNEQLKNLE